MFKNEATIIKSWLDHYIREGVDHFYLIDNGSSDNFKEVLEPYMGRITLKSDPMENSETKQLTLYNMYLDKVKSEASYVFVCDIDEYLYTKTSLTTLRSYLEKNPLEYGISIPWKLFGTISYETPSNIINIVRRRCLNYPIPDTHNLKGYSKSIFSTKHLIRLDTHEPDLENYILPLVDNYHELQLNHYKLISEHYFKTVKIVRGGGTSGLIYEYTMPYFYECLKTFNEEEDRELQLKMY